MKLSRGMGKMFTGRTAANWAKRTLQSAVFIAVASSVPAAWSAGAGPVNVAAASNPSLHVNNVAYGSANFSTNGAVTTVTTGSRRTIINYDYLSVGAGATLDFAQPTAHSKVFNRIGGGTVTAIDGTVISNGGVYFVNNAGIIFGNGAVIQTGDFKAAASHLSDADFLAGRDNFTNSGGSVTNFGTIRAENVSLVGANVANFGAIVAGDSSGHGGIVTMTAGTDVYIGTVSGPTASPHILVKVSNNTGSVNAGTGVTNNGTISGGEIQLGAGDVYAAGIYNGGAIRGTSITLDSTASTNVNTGTIDASSTTGVGGTVEVLGNKVGVFGGSINASGLTGGGTILVGGDAHGAGPVETASKTLVGDATLSADATGSGNGGKVVVWSNDLTIYTGAISVNGSGQGGNGGWVETSSHNYLQADGSVSAHAGQGGASGVWLLDPRAVNIDTGANNNINVTGTNPLSFSSDGTGTGNANVSQINSALSNGTSVIVTTALGTGNGTISVNANIVMAAANNSVSANLSLISGSTVGDINVTAGNSITATTGVLNLTLTANAGTGDVTISAPISLNGGAFNSTGVNFTTVSAGTITAGSANITHTGNVAIASNISLGNGTLTVSGLAFTQSNNTITAGLGTFAVDSINQSGGNMSISNVSVAATNGDVILTRTGNAFTNVAVSDTKSGANVSVTSSTGLTVNTVNSVNGISTAGGGVVTVVAGGNLVVTQNVTSTGNVSLTANGNGSITGAGIINAGNVVLNASGNGTSVINSILNTTGNMSFNSGGNLTISDGANALATSKITSLSVGGSTISFTTTSTFTVDADLSIGGGTLLVNAAGITVNNAKKLIAGNVTFVDSIGTSVVGNITLTGNFNSTQTTFDLASTGIISAVDTNILGTGAVTFEGTLTATGVARIAGSSVIQTTGTITAPTLGVSASNNTLGQSIVFTNANVSTFAADASTGNGTILLTTTGNVTLGSVSGLSASGGIPAFTALTKTQGDNQDIIIISGGKLVISGDVTANNGGSGGNATLTATGNITRTAGVISGDNVSLTATGGGIGANGTPVLVATSGGLTLVTTGLGSAGSVFVQANGTLNTTALTVTTDLSLQTISVSATGALTVGTTLGLANTLGNDNIVLSGSTLSIGAGEAVTGDNVSLTATAGDLNIAGALTATGASGVVALTATGGAILETAGGAITAPNLSATATGVNSGKTIDLAQAANVVLTFAANGTGSGTVGFTNSGGFTVGTVGSVTGVSSANQAISLLELTSSITLSQNVNAGTGNATANATTAIVGGAGVVTGDTVTLIATNDIGSSGTKVNTASTTLLSLSGANIFVVDSNALTTAGTRLSVTTVSGDTVDLTASSISITNSFGLDTSSPLALHTTTGAITATGGAVLTASTLTLDSKTSIGTALNPVTVTLGGALTVSSQAVGAHTGDIFVASTTDLNLNSVSVTGTANQTVSFTAGNITVASPFNAAGNFVVLTATSATGGLTISDAITASSVTVKTDDIFFTTGGAFLTGANGSVSISPNSAGVTTVGIGPGIAPLAGRLSIDSGLLAASTAGTVTISAGATGSMTVGVGGAVNLSGASYGLSLQAPGGLDFANTLTLASGTTFTIASPGGVTDSTGVGVPAISIAGGTLIITGTTADIGSGASPLQTQVANLGGVTGTGHLFLTNTGALVVNGAVALTAGGVATSNLIATASPLTISANMSFVGDLALTAGDNSAVAGDTLTVSNNVIATGNIALQAGDGIVLNGGIISTTLNVSLTANHENDLTTDVGNGDISQSGTAGIHAATLTANATTGILLNGSNNQVATFIANNVTGADAAAGNISLTNTGTAGLALSLGKIENDASGGSISIVTTGAVTQSGSIFSPITTNGGNFSVQTKNASGSPITLTNSANDFGAGKVTLQVLDASGNPTVFKDVAITTSGQLHIQEIESGANVTLTGTTIDQVVGDAVGISASKLAVLSNGAVALTDANNTFTSLQATDTGGAVSLQYTTSSNGLSILGLSQNTGGLATIIDSNGSITSNVALTSGTLTLKAKGGISLSNTSNSFTGLVANNTTTGNIVITDATALNVSNLSQTGGNTTLTDTGGLTVSGPLAAGTGLVISVPTGGGTFTSTGAANITSSGTVSITADGMSFTLGSVIGANGTVTLKPFTTTEAIAINGSGGGVLNISNAALNSITAPSVVLGSTSESGDISGTGAIFLPENVVLITTGNISLAGATITSAATAQLQALHNGTFSLASATLNGGLLEASTTGSGAGGLVSLSGTLNTNDNAVAFNSQVQLTGNAAINTVGSTGGDIAFNFVGTTSVSSTTSGNLTLTAGTGNITFASPAGGLGSELGILQVVSAKNVTLPAVRAVGENINNSGTLTINATQTLGSGGFTQTGATAVTLGGNIVTNGTLAGGGIVFNSPMTLTGPRTLDSTNGGATTGGNITVNGVVTGGANNFALIAGGGNVGVGANITTTGTFNSSGVDFNNTPVFPATNAIITAHGITINHTGVVTIASSLASAGFAVIINGSTITVQNGATVTGSTVSMPATIGVVINDAIFAPTGYNSSGNSTFTISSTGSISTSGANATINYGSGLVSLQGPISAGAGTVSITGLGITSNSAGTINGGIIGLTAGAGPVNIGGAIVGTGLVSTSGAGFTNTASITGAGITINQTGLVQIQGALIGGSGAVNVTGVGITSNANGTISGAAITLAGGTGDVTLAGVVTGTGLFTSTGAAFTNNANITSAGANITHTGAINIDGSLIDTGNAVVVSGVGITSNANGAISGSTITLTGGSGNVILGATVTGTGLFTSTGAAFTNNANITSVGANITHTGAINIDGALAGGSGDVGVSGTTITANGNGTISGANITLVSGGLVSLGAQVTGTGNFTSNGTTFSEVGISATGITLNHTGLVTLNGNMTATGNGTVNITGAGVTQSSGIINAGKLGLIGTGTFALADNNTVGTLAANITGPLTFVNNTALTVGTVGATSGITTNGGLISLTVNSGDLTVSQALSSGAGTISLVASSGNVVVNANATTSSTFTSNGTAFTNTGTITAAGITLNQTGLVTINGALASSGNPVSITGVGITSNANGTINGSTITLAAGVGNTSLGGTITGSGLFTSTGAAFTNTAGITSAGANITHTGAVNIDGALVDTLNPVIITGVGIASNANGTIAGSTITLTAGSGDISLGGTITGSGLFKSTGANFTNTAGITSTGANITQTGAVNIDGALADSGNPVVITGVGITSNGNGTINGSTITLAAGVGNTSLGGTITGSGLFTSTGAAFTNTAGITSVGANITHTGAVNIDGALADGSSVVVISGNGITSNANGTINAGNVTLTGGAGNVTVGGIINSSGVFISTGAAFTNNASISSAGANITQTGAVNINDQLFDLGTPIVITGVGITSAANSSISGSTITLNSGSGDVVLNGSTTSGGLFSSTGVNFTNNGTIAGQGITLTHSGVVTLNNTVNAQSGALSITGASSITDANSTLSGVGVTLHSTGAIGVGGLIDGTSGAVALTSDTSSVSATGGINGLSAIVTGSTTVAVGAVTTTGGNITLIGPTSITLDGDLNAGTSNVSVQGPAILGANVTVTGSAVDFVNAITGAGKSLTVNASGLTTFGGDVGTSGSPIASLTTDSAGSTTLNGSIFGTGAVAINDPLLITGATTVSGGTVAFGSTIHGGGTGGLIVTSVTSSTFNGTIGVGGGNQLTTLEVDGGTATFAAPTISTSGNQTYTADVLLTTAAVLGGTNVSFSGNIDSTGTPVALTINAAGAVSLTGDTGGTNPLASLTVTGSTLSTLNQSITTTGDISVDGPINIGATVTSTGGNVSLAGTVTLTGNTVITANGATGISFGLTGITGSPNITFISNSTTGKIIVGAFGSGTLNPNGSVTGANRVGNVVFDSAGVVQLNGDIFAQSLKFAYKTDGATPTISPIATVYSANGDLILSTNGAFDMEQNQSLSVFASTLFGNTPTTIGNLSIVSNNHPISIGDLSAAGSITVNAGAVNQTITIRGRAPAQMDQSSGGPVNSQAVSIVSGLNTPGAIFFKGNVSVTGTGSQARAQFSSGSATVDIANKTGQLVLGDVTKILDFNRSNAIPSTKFVLVVGSTPEALNQVASGIGLPPQNQVNVVPRDVQTLEPEREEAISGALKDALLELGIYARDLRTDELIEYLVGTALYDDVPYKLNPSPQDTQMAANRLPYAPVLPTVDAYRSLFLKPELDDKGNPVLDANGKPKMVAQDTNIKNAFGQAWLAYTRDLKEKATPDGFRGYLESHAAADKKDAGALTYLNQLRDLLNQIKNLGLTDTELDVSKKVLLAKVRPANIKEDDFLAAIMGPSTTAKNMTAMK